MLTEKRLSMQKLYKAICLAERSTPETMGFSFKTFQRFLAGTGRVGDEVVAVCARFAKGLPRPARYFHALGESLHALFKIPLSRPIWRFLTPYTVTTISSTLIFQSIPRRGRGFALVSGGTSTASQLHRQS